MEKKHLLFIVIFLVLFSVVNLSAQSCLPSGITFGSQTQIDEFASNYPGCTHILGDVVINKTFTQDTIKNLNGLSQLSRISGSLVFKENLNLANAEGLENLTIIGGSLTAFDFSLNSLSGLNALDSIGGDVRIEESDSPLSFKTFERLKFIGGDFVLDHAQLIDFSGLEQLTTIGNHFLFIFGTLSSFEGLENLRTIGGDFLIENTMGLTNDFSGLEKLQSIGGDFAVLGTSMVSFNGLQNLNSNNGYLFIVDNENLVSLHAIANLNPTTIDLVQLSSNPQLEVCAEPVICNCLLSGINVNIQQNKAGCQSSAEVELACADANFSSVRFDIYYDLNQNKVQDEGEPIFADAGVTIDPLGIIGFPGLGTSGGIIYLDYGNYTVSYDSLLTPNWDLTTDSTSFFASLSEMNTSDTVSFGVYPNKVYSEMITTINSDLTRCDQWINFEVYAKNIGTTITEGTLWFELDSNITEVMLVDTPQTIEDDLYGWDFEALFPGETITKNILLKIPGPLDFTLGDSLHFGSYIGFTIPAGGIYSSRYFNYDPIVRCSYDPNDKLVYPNRKYGYTLFEEDLFYTVRFQNTGNDVAYDVVILDTLDTNLDPASFRVLSTSHPQYLKTTMEANRYLRFEFNDIFLPDSTSNFDESQGYVNYMISPKDGLAEETKIENTASIYFDTNPPVVTNTTENIMVSELPMTNAVYELGTKTIQLSIFPNPTTGMVELISEDLEAASMELRDLTGRLLLQQNFSKSDHLDLSNYPTGFYFISFRKDGDVFTEKIIKY